MDGPNRENAGNTTVPGHVQVGGVHQGADPEGDGQIAGTEIGTVVLSETVGIALETEIDVIETTTETGAERRIGIITETANLGSIVMKVQKFQPLCQSLCVKNEGKETRHQLSEKVAIQVQSAQLQKVVNQRRNILDVIAVNQVPEVRTAVKWTVHQRVRMELKTMIPSHSPSQMIFRLNRLLLGSN